MPPKNGGRAPSPQPLLGMQGEELQRLLQQLDQPPYRAAQIHDWIYRRHQTDAEAMTDLPAALRRRLGAVTDVALERTHTRADGTVKFVLRLCDDRRVEAVMIPEGRRRTACLSSQVGCPIGCVFCASGLDGIERNLSTQEILAQFLWIQRHLGPGGGLTNVVLMGMGEPLLNLDALLPALSALNDPEHGFGFGARRITVSTVGIAGRIPRLAGAGLQVGLALSLHAPTEALRRKLVPYPQRAALDELLADADLYRQQTGRAVTVEYVLLAGTNDQPEHARALGRLLRGRRHKVNLIPWNPVARMPHLRRPEPGAVERFAAILAEAGLVCTVRRQRGDDIAAACGQLAQSASG